MHHGFTDRIDGQIAGQNDKLNRFKRDTNEGLSIIQQSIQSMKEVNDGKRQILEEQLKKEIAMIRKMVVLI